MSPPLVLVAHGSRDPRAAPVADHLAQACTRAGVDTRAAFLDHAGPRPDDVLVEIAQRGHRRAVVVPLLFTAAYHARVDVPSAVRTAHGRAPSLAVTQGASLAPDELLLDALDRRLAELDGLAPDGLVLAAAGTSDAAARTVLAGVAVAWGDRHGVPGRVAWASTAAPDPGVAVAALHAEGARRVVVGSLFLAPGLLTDRAASQALAAGAHAVTAPLGAAPEVRDLLLARYGAALG